MEIFNKLDEIINESSHQFLEGSLRQRIFNRSVYYGILKGLTTKLDISTLRDYFKELENMKSPSKIGGLDVLQKVLKNKTEEMWNRIKLMNKKD